MKRVMRRLLWRAGLAARDGLSTDAGVIQRCASARCYTAGRAAMSGLQAVVTGEGAERSAGSTWTKKESRLDIRVARTKYACKVLHDFAYENVHRSYSRISFMNERNLS